MRKINNRVGETNINNQGLKMTIIEYRNATDIDILFENGNIRQHMRYDHFKDGNIIDKKINHLNEEIINNQGLKMKIIRYRTNYDMDVEFEDGYIKKNVGYNSFKRGSVNNPYHKCYYGVACKGETKITDGEGNELKSYKVWSSMLQRCYDVKYQEIYPTYKDCTVCEDWLCYANFKVWYDNNIYEIEDEVIHLDKDILVENNKIYSPSTCIFTPRYINELFRNKPTRSLPKGVCYNKNWNKYIVYKYIYNKKYFIGGYDTIEEALSVWNKVRKEVMAQIASDYKGKIPNKLYDRLIELSL